MKLIGKIGLTAIVGLLLIKLLFGGRGDQGVDIPRLVKDGALIVDTRTPGEYSGGHVKHAINIPYDIIARAIDQYETDQSKPIIVYCLSGSRSSYAKRSLIEAGYTNVVDAGSMGNMQKQIR